MKEAENLYAEHYVKYKLMNYTLASTVQKKKTKKTGTILVVCSSLTFSGIFQAFGW